MLRAAGWTTRSTRWPEERPRDLEELPCPPIGKSDGVVLGPLSPVQIRHLSPVAQDADGTVPESPDEARTDARAASVRRKARGKLRRLHPFHAATRLTPKKPMPARPLVKVAVKVFTIDKLREE